MPRPLPRSTATAEQLDPAAVLALLDALEAHPAVEPHSLMVLRHGHVVVEGWWAPYAADRPHLLYSLSKTFTGTAVALAQAEGLLDLDDTLVSHLPEVDDEITDSRSRSVWLRHLAAMASGHTHDMLSDSVLRSPGHLVRGLLLLPPEREPGSVFAYSQPCTYALGSVVQRRSGQRLSDYLRPRLLDPLGIGEVGWLLQEPEEHEQGYSGLFARTEDVAKLGQLHLQRGQWGGRQLVPQEWVDAASTKQVDTAEPSPDWRQGYGFQLWQSRHGYRGDGAFGQFCLVLPDQDAVVVTTAHTLDMQAVLDSVWSVLLPGFDREPTDPQAQQRLDDRVVSLCVPVLRARVRPDDERAWHGVGPLPVVDAQRKPSALTHVELWQEGAAWWLRLVEHANALALPVGTGEWAVSAPTDGTGAQVPVAGACGWLEDGTARVEVLLLQTPHRLDVELDPHSRTACASWREHPPLGADDLTHLHCPPWPEGSGSGRAESWHDHPRS